MATNLRNFPDIHIASCSTVKKNTDFWVFSIFRSARNFAAKINRHMKATALLAAATFISLGAYATQPAEKPKETNSVISRISLGGYGEACYTRNFYSDNVNRYSHAADYTDAPSHGRFDIPHVVIELGFDFGKGWRMGSEIEFEHGGTGSAVELEAEEVGEFEQETERGGEVALEQFWIEKQFKPWLNLRAGHQVVPVGYTNAHHLPTEFFTVYRPEGENQIMPCTWHATGLEIWGRAGDWRYEAMVMPSLNSLYFSKDEWVKNGTTSPFEFEPANKIAFAARIDNHSIKGLRLSASGFYGHTFSNTLQADNGRYKDVTGALAIGSFDFAYKGYGLIVRGNFDYGHLSDADKISQYNRNQSKTSPYKRTYVGKAAISTAIEAGYDIFRLLPSNASTTGQNLYIFGRYEYYDAYIPTADAPDYSWTDRQRIAFGLNWFPIKQIVLKAEFSERLLKSRYNNEPSISLGVAYAGFFL